MTVMDAPKRVIVTVHGIRTFGQWQVRLHNLIKAADPDTVVVAYEYGYFSVLAFIIPMFRWLAVRAFRRRARSLTKDYPEARFSFVAHSFGTHIVAYGLRSLGREAPGIDTIVLCGSVLRSQFDWDKFLARVPARRVVNDCGVNDSVLVLSQLVVLFTGMAGRVGFYGFSGGNVFNRFFAGGHSHYFQPTGSDPDAFMRQNWLKLLTTQENVDWVEERPVPTALDGVKNALMRVADPLKISVYALLFWLALDILYLQPRVQAQTEQAAREIAAAVTLVDANRSLPDAFASLARLLATNAAPLESQQAEAANTARYVRQRLSLFGSAYGALQDGALFRWGGNVYLKAKQPIRLEFPVLSYAVVPAAARLVVVSADSTVRVLDMQSGKTLAIEQFDEGDGLVNGSVNYYALQATLTDVAVEFYFDDPNADEGHRWTINVTLPTAKLTPLANRLTANADCTEFRGGTNDDDEDLTDDEIKEMKRRLAEEKQIAEKCLRSFPGTQPIQFAFPAALSEADIWQAQADEAQPDATEYGCPTLLGAQGRVREDLSTLDFSAVPDSNATILENQITDPDTYGTPACVIQFGTKAGKQYIVTNGLIGQWYVGLILCELSADDRILACAYPSYAWNGSGELTLSDDGRFLTLAGYGSGEGAFWNLIDLDRMEIIDPDERPRTQTLGIVIGEQSDTVMVATLVPDQPGAVEAWFYRIGRRPVLAARRVLEAPSGSVTTDENGNDVTVGSIAFRSGENFVLATPFQQVFAMRLQDSGVLPRWLNDAWHSLARLPAVSETVGLVWVAPDAGLGASTQVKYEVAVEEGTLAVYSSRALRLLNLTNGRFLSPPIDLTRVSPCSGSIRSVTVEPSGSVVAKLDGCAATRSAPVTAEAARAQASDVGDYLGGGDAITRRLPGEVRPPS